MLCPTAGVLQVFGAIEKAKAAYFENDQRAWRESMAVKCALSHMMTNPIRRPPWTLREILSRTKRPLMFGSFGTPGETLPFAQLDERQNSSTLCRLRRRPSEAIHRCSRGQWVGSPQFGRGRIYANYITAFYSGKRDCSSLAETIISGRELVQGLEDGLGDIARMIQGRYRVRYGR